MTIDAHDRIRAVVLEAIAYSAGVDRAAVQSSACIADLGLDSVGIAALKLVLEAELEVHIDDETLHTQVVGGSLADATAAVYRCWVSRSTTHA